MKLEITLAIPALNDWKLEKVAIQQHKGHNVVSYQTAWPFRLSQNMHLFHQQLRCNRS